LHHAYILLPHDVRVNTSTDEFLRVTFMIYITGLSIHRIHV